MKHGTGADPDAFVDAESDRTSLTGRDTRGGGADAHTDPKLDVRVDMDVVDGIPGRYIHAKPRVVKKSCKIHEVIPRKGAKVLVRLEAGGAEHSGTIREVNEDGSFEVDFDKKGWSMRSKRTPESQMLTIDQLKVDKDKYQYSKDPPVSYTVIIDDPQHGA